MNHVVKLVTNYLDEHHTLTDLHPDTPCCIYRPIFRGCRKYGTNMVSVMQNTRIGVGIGHIIYSIHSQTHPFSVVIEGASQSYSIILPSIAKEDGGHFVNIFQGWPTAMTTSLLAIPQDAGIQLELEAEVEVVVPCEERYNIEREMLIPHNYRYFLPILHEGTIHNLCSFSHPIILGQLE